MRRIRLWTCYFTRSEFGPLSPLLNELHIRENTGSEVELQVEDLSLGYSPETIGALFRSYEPDLVLCGFDRPEMVPVAYEAYHLGLPIAQIFAGDIAGGAYDDADRFNISSYASLLFCATTKAKQRVSRALQWRKELQDDFQVHVVGATSFDDMLFAQPSDIETPFDLVLYNPPSMATKDQVQNELIEITKHLWSQRTVIWVEPNGDRYSDFIREQVDAMGSCGMLTVRWKDSMPRKEFLGYLRLCTRFLGNSSSMFYEAAYWDKIIIQIGMRNKYREPIPKSKAKPGASKRIADIMIDYCKMRETKRTEIKK